MFRGQNVPLWLFYNRGHLYSKSYKGIQSTVLNKHWCVVKRSGLQIFLWYMYMYFKTVFVFGKMILSWCFTLFSANSCGLLSVPRSTKSSFNYSLGNTVRVTGCRVGTLQGQTDYTCTDSGNSREWSPGVSASCSQGIQLVLKISFTSKSVFIQLHTVYSNCNLISNKSYN